MSAFITLDKIIRDVCVANGDTDFSQYNRVMRSAGLAVEDVFFNLIPQIKSELLEVQSNLTLQMPDDCVLVTKVGVIDTEGRLLVLYEESDLRRRLANKQKEQAEDCDDTTTNVTASSDVIVADIPFYNCGAGMFTDVVYGYTYDPGRVGTYRYDKSAGIVELGSGEYIVIGSDVVVEYKSNSSENLQMIPAEAQSVIMARTQFHLNMGLRPQVAELQFRQFEREYKQLKRVYLRKNPEEYIRAFTRHFSPTPH